MFRMLSWDFEMKEESTLSHCVNFYVIINFLATSFVYRLSVPTGSLTCGLAERSWFRGGGGQPPHTHQHTFSTASTHLVSSHTDCCCLHRTNPTSACGSCDLFLFPLRIPLDRHHGARWPREEDHLGAEVSQQCHYHQRGGKPIAALLPKESSCEQKTHPSVYLSRCWMPCWRRSVPLC